MTVPLDERLRRLGAWADPFADPGFTFGEWVAPTIGADGVIQVGWFAISDAGQQFVSEMYELEWVYAFDWMKWRRKKLPIGAAIGPSGFPSPSKTAWWPGLPAITRKGTVGPWDDEPSALYLKAVGTGTTGWVRMAQAIVA